MRETPAVVDLPFVMLRVRGVLVGLAICFLAVIAAGFAVLASVPDHTFRLLIATAVVLLLAGSVVVVASAARMVLSALRAGR